MKDMTTGNPAKLIFSFAIPLLIGNIFQQLYLFTDTWVVGRTLGDTALAAIGGSSGTLVFLFFGFAMGLIGGLSALTSQHFGAKNYDKVRQAIATSLVIVTVFCVCIAVFGCTFMRGILHLLDTPEAPFEMAHNYLMILFAFSFLTFYIVFIYNTLRALGDSVTPLYFLVFSNILNAGLNWTFVKYCGWGVNGVAWATVIAQTSSLVLCLVYSLKKFPILRLKKSDFVFTRESYWKHLKMGIPSGLTVFITALGSCILQRVVNGFGPEAVAGVSAIAPLSNLTYLPLGSIGTALMNYTAQNYGARNLHRIRSGVRSTFVIVMLFSGISTVVMYVFAPWMVAFFLNENSAPAVLDHGIRSLRMMCPFYPILAVLFVFRNTQQAMALPKAPFYSGIAEFFLRIIGAYVLARLFGFEGAFLSHPLAWTGASIVVVVDYALTLRRFRIHGIPKREGPKPMAVHPAPLHHRRNVT